MMKRYLFIDLNCWRIGLFMLFVMMVAGSISAQSLTDKIGGVSTDFNIYYGEYKLDIQQQVIIKRGLSSYAVNEILPYEAASAYGYGLETFRFEFLSSDFINFKSKSGNYYNIQLDLMDADGSILLSLNIDANNIWSFTSQKNFNAYSINLQNIPLVVFNETKHIKINIMK